jgi:sugar phosphate isomerase/epimerase
VEEHDLLATSWTSAGAVRPGDVDDRSAVPIEDRIRAAVDAGFSGFGIDDGDLHTIRSTIGFDALHRLLDDAGVVWVQLGTLTDWWTTGARRDDSDANRGLLLEAAATLRASHIIVGADATPAAASPEAMLEDWTRLADQAEQVGAQLVLEAVPWSNLPTVERAARFVQRAGHPNGGILVDAMHALRGGSTLASMRTAIAPETVFAVELSDGLLSTPVGMTLCDESRDARYLPGTGAWDLPGFIRTMRELGFDEPWGVEVCTPAHRATPVADALRTAAAATRAVLDAADAFGAPAAPPMPTGPAPTSAVDYDLPHHTTDA